MMVDKCFVQVFYHVPIQDILQYMEEQVEKTSVVDPIIFPFRQMLWTITWCCTTMNAINVILPKILSTSPARIASKKWNAQPKVGVVPKPICH